MGAWLHQALPHLLRRLWDAGAHTQAQRPVGQAIRSRLQSPAHCRASRRRAAPPISSTALAMPRCLTLVIALCLAAPAGICGAAQPWMDASLDPDRRADLVISQMTLDEKIQLVHGIGWGP